MVPDKTTFRIHKTLFKQNPLEIFFFFTIYQNYTMALKGKFSSGREGALASKLNYDLK